MRKTFWTRGLFRITNYEIRNTKWRRSVFPFFVFHISYFVFAVYFLSACGPKADAGSDEAKRPAAATPDQSIRDFEIKAFSGGRHDWTLSSPSAELFEHDDSIDVKDPSVQFYEEGEHSSSLTAGWARIDTRSKDMWARDGVVITSTDGARLTSEHLHYVNAKDRILSTAPVTIEQKDTIIRGVGWEASPDLSELSVTNQQVEILGSPVRKGK